MKQLLLFTFSFLYSLLWAHDIHYEKVVLRHWTLEKANEKSIDASFFMYKNGEVFLEDAQNKVLHYPLSAFSKTDQAYILQRYEAVKQVNQQLFVNQPTQTTAFNGLDYKFFWISLFAFIFAGYIYFFANKKKMTYFTPVLGMAVIFMIFGFTEKSMKGLQTHTNPVTMDSAFSPFKPKIHTFWDNTYFYVESQGIPDHQMMVGITAWQQQVPIPQCYTGANAWSIPLNPVIAATPVPVNQQHFLRGAVAIAVNGVPIFNPYTNTGADAYLTGQLDNWGGHCGRADDYHYHIAPMTLYNQTAANMPIAYALDGFAVYGNVEPDGTNMQTLDANHGHYGANGVYHYHGSATAPYMIGNMVGEVTEDSTLQIIPQAAAHPVRPSLTPLTGAVITDCQPNGTNNGYILTYTKSGLTYSVDYNWTANGIYTFNFISPTGTTTSTYNGFTQCTLPTTIENASMIAKQITLFPTPATEVLYIKLSKEIAEKEVQAIHIYNTNGTLVYTTTNYKPAIFVKNWSKGIYTVNIRLTKGEINEKIVVQ